MGQMIVDRVVSLLQEEGIRAEAAFPGERITRVTEPVAAVSLEKADLDDRTATVLVEIFAPQESGGYLCQKKALEACAILEADGSVCTQGSCEFLGKGHVFRVPVKATYHGVARANDMEEPAKFTILAGELPLQYAVGFTAKQVGSAKDGITQDTVWEYTIEEFFPWGIMETRMASDHFDLSVKCMGNVERYADSVWIRRQRTVEEKGIRQFMTAIAQKMVLTSE